MFVHCKNEVMIEDKEYQDNSLHRFFKLNSYT